MNSFASIMRGKVWLLILFSLVLAFQPASSQVKSKEAQEPKRFSDKLFYGGTLGLMVGDITRIDVLPIAGIWVIPQWSVGVGGRYGYLSQKGYYMLGGSQVYRSHIWGASGFTQILPIVNLSEVTPIKVNGGIIFHGEYETLYIDQKMIDPFNTTEAGKTWIHLYLAGVGYRQIVGRRAAVNILFLWDFSKSNYSPYTTTPILRVNVTF